MAIRAAGLRGSLLRRLLQKPSTALGNGGRDKQMDLRNTYDTELTISSEEKQMMRKKKSRMNSKFIAWATW